MLNHRMRLSVEEIRCLIRMRQIKDMKENGFGCFLFGLVISFDVLNLRLGT